ncbi:MAG TPA: hypothetical protein VLH77_03935, partial [Gammaproteobacteria bacterium]|nr:hypothetical protein [Gammaproteobacteria bacterium]
MPLVLDLKVKMKEDFMKKWITVLIVCLTLSSSYQLLGMKRWLNTALIPASGSGSSGSLGSAGSKTASDINAMVLTSDLKNDREKAKERVAKEKARRKADADAKKKLGRQKKAIERENYLAWERAANQLQLWSMVANSPNPKLYGWSPEDVQLFKKNTESYFKENASDQLKISPGQIADQFDKITGPSNLSSVNVIETQLEPADVRCAKDPVQKLTRAVRYYKGRFNPAGQPNGRDNADKEIVEALQAGAHPLHGLYGSFKETWDETIDTCRPLMKDMKRSENFGLFKFFFEKMDPQKLKEHINGRNLMNTFLSCIHGSRLDKN